MLCILHHLTASESDLMWCPECFVVINGLICLSVYFFFCTEPNKNYVILLIAINSKGNGPDVQTKLQTLSGIGKSFKGNFNKTFNLFSNLFKTYL